MRDISSALVSNCVVMATRSFVLDMVVGGLYCLGYFCVRVLLPFEVSIIINCYNLDKVITNVYYFYELIYT